MSIVISGLFCEEDSSNRMVSCKEKGIVRKDSCGIFIMSRGEMERMGWI